MYEWMHILEENAGGQLTSRNQEMYCQSETQSIEGWAWPYRRVEQALKSAVLRRRQETGIEGCLRRPYKHHSLYYFVI